MKITMPFVSFSARVEPLGLVAVRQTGTIFFVKSFVPGAGKIEINLNSATFTVGSGSKHLAAITEAVQSAGFAIKKQTKGWTVVDIHKTIASSSNEDLITALCGQFIELVSVVNAAVTANQPIKTVKMSAIIKKVGAEFRKPKVDVEAIKAKNLETMKAVSRALWDAA